MKTVLLWTGVTLCLAGWHLSLTVADERAKPPAEGEKRELLAQHRTVARFVNVEDHVCRGLTGLCPDRCGNSGPVAEFAILSYTEYRKPGKYGDDKAKSFRLQLADNLKNPKVPAEIAEIVASLKPGDHVRLEWNHDYVTRTLPNGIQSSAPERPVVKLEKINPAETEKPGQP